MSDPFRDCSAVEIHFAGREALDEVHTLVRLCYGDQAESPAWWAWRYFGRGAPFSEFCLARKDGALVGIQPVSWMRFQTERNVLAGGVLTGVMVHPGYRRRGLFSLLIAACEQRAWARQADFLLTMPNDRSRPLFWRLGWINPGQRTLLIRVLDRETVVRRAASAAFPIALLILRALFPEDSRLEEPAPLIPAATPASVKDPLPSEEGVGLEVERNPEWLRWRYWGSPDAQYRCWATGPTTQGGFGVYALQAWKGLNAAYFLEARGSSPTMKGRLIRALADAARADGAAVAVAVESSAPDLDAYRKAGFHAVPGMLSPKRFWTAHTIRPGRTESPAVPGRIRDWALHLGDWDGI